MTLVTRRTTISALAVGVLALLAVAAAAQTYPSRTVTVVVPFPAGGSVDGVARILVQKLNETVGQHFIVENRAGGASGTVGANAVAKAAPDGYSLLVSASVTNRSFALLSCWVKPRLQAARVASSFVAAPLKPRHSAGRQPAKRLVRATPV